MVGWKEMGTQPKGCLAAYLHPRMDAGLGWACGPQSSSPRAGAASASPALTKKAAEQWVDLSALKKNRIDLIFPLFTGKN